MTPNQKKKKITEASVQVSRDRPTKGSRFEERVTGIETGRGGNVSAESSYRVQKGREGKEKALFDSTRFAVEEEERGR